MEVGAAARIRESCLAPSPPVEATTAKQKDQHNDHKDQRGIAHDFPLPFESSLQASPPAPNLRSALSTRGRDCRLRTNYPTGTGWPPQALAKTTVRRGAAASHAPPARPTSVGRALDIGTGARGRWRARRSKPRGRRAARPLPRCAPGIRCVAATVAGACAPRIARELGWRPSTFYLSRGVAPG